MSNPSINRWGVNTFWHNFWYSDNHYSYNVKQDNIFTKLLHIYLYNGINIPKYFWTNTYWYFNNRHSLKLYTYKRIRVIKPLSDKEKVNCLARQTRDAAFFFKLWIYKYDNWIIINQLWFHPDKKKHKRKFFVRKSHINNYRVISADESGVLRRLKTIFSVKFHDHILKKSYYTF